MEGKLGGILAPLQVFEGDVEPALDILRPVPLRLLHAVSFTVCTLAIDELNDALQVLSEVFLPILVLECEIAIANEADASLQTWEHLAHMLHDVR